MPTLERLADADTFRSLDLDRRQALWAVRGLGGVAPIESRTRAPEAPRLIGPEHGDLFDEPPVALPVQGLGEHVAADYAATGLSLKAHPVAFFREELSRRGVITSAEHWEERARAGVSRSRASCSCASGPARPRASSSSPSRTRPASSTSSSGRKRSTANRRVVMTAQFLLVRGRIEREGLVIHVVAESFVDLSARLSDLSDGAAALPDGSRDVREGSWRNRSRDFH